MAQRTLLMREKFVSGDPVKSTCKLILDNT